MNGIDPLDTDIVGAFESAMGRSDIAVVRRMGERGVQREIVLRYTPADVIAIERKMSDDERRMVRWGGMVNGGSRGYANEEARTRMLLVRDRLDRRLPVFYGGGGPWHLTTLGIALRFLMEKH